MQKTIDYNLSNGPAERLSNQLFAGIGQFWRIKSQQTNAENKAKSENKYRIKFGLLCVASATLAALDVKYSAGHLLPTIGAVVGATTAVRTGSLALDANKSFNKAQKEAETLGHKADGAKAVLETLGAAPEYFVKVKEETTAAKSVSRIKRMFGG